MILNKIKTTYTKGLLILGLLAITSNCSESLDLDPKTNWAAEDFYGNEADINAAFAGIYSKISSGNSFGEKIMQMNAGTDESYKRKDWNERNPVSINAHNPGSEGVTHAWQTLYEGVNNTNSMIKFIDPAKFDDEADFNRYLGEAKFLRGFFYYHLTCWYNELPLRLEPAVDQSSNHVAPSPVKDVYEQIIADLEFAAENLPSSFEPEYIPGHANSGAAHAMLAKIYLKAAGFPLQATEINGKNPYQAAIDHCLDVEELGHGLSNPSSETSYKDVFLNYIQNRFDVSETLFEIVYRNGTDIGANIGGRNGYGNGLFYNVKTSKVNEPTTEPDMVPSPIFEEIYEEGDRRKAWNVPFYSGVKNQWNPNGKVIVAPDALNWTFSIGKFRRWDAAHPDDIDLSNAQINPIVTLETPVPVHQSLTGINFPLLRFSDVLLMLAEAENALNGPTGIAKEAINRVRLRAGLDNLPDLGQDDFFNEITNERMRELCFEGHRKHDLIRWGLYEAKLTVLNYQITGHGSYTPNFLPKVRAYTNFDPSRHLSLPYPEQEVLINNLLDQKPEWQ